MGKINASDKIMFENLKQWRKYRNKRNVYINIHLKDHLDMNLQLASLS